MRRAVIVLVLLAAVGCGPGALGSDDPVSEECATELQPLVTELSELDSRLDVGMNFATYGERVGDVRVAYDQIRFDQLDQHCITRAGQPAEGAFNDYIAAYNRWNACMQDSDCETASIEPELQRHWSAASIKVDVVRAALP